MYCNECLDHINQKEKHTYVVINKYHSLYKCKTCHDSSRFKTLVDKCGLCTNEKKELLKFKYIMDTQNKTIMKLLANLYEKTGLKLF